MSRLVEGIYAILYKDAFRAGRRKSSMQDRELFCFTVQQVLCTIRISVLPIALFSGLAIGVWCYLNIDRCRARRPSAAPSVSPT